jgi:DNA repair protein RadC
MVNELLQVAEVEVSYRPKFKASERPKVNTSEEVYRLFINQWNLDKIQLQEEFKVMLLNRTNRVLGIADISVGGVSGTVADPKIIFSIALKGNASSIVLAHNHPSGNLRTSEADIRLTKKLVQAGLLLELPIYDHLIITNDGYYSFADDGMM